MMDFTKQDIDSIKSTIKFDNGEQGNMFFVLDFDTDDNFYSKLLNKFLAIVIMTPNNHSMVLADPEKTKYFHPKIPAFDIKYIEDCFKFQNFPDPTKYLIETSSPLNYNKDQIFDCWLHQDKSWFDLIPNSEKKKNNGEMLSFKLSEIINARNPEIIFPKLIKPGYGRQDDIRIVNYITKHKLANNVTGVDMWKRMEHDKVCKFMFSWECMKKKYFKHIVNQANKKNGNLFFPTLEELEKLQESWIKMGIVYKA